MQKFVLDINDPELLSAIATGAAKHGRSIDEEALAILRQAAAAEGLREKIGELQAIHDIGLMANSSLDIKVVLQRIMEGTMAALDAPVGMIFERNVRTGCLHWMAQKGLSQDFVKSYEDRPIHPGEGLTGRIAESGQPIYIRENSSSDPRIARAVTAAESLNSFIGVPIFAEGEVVAVMNILTYSSKILEKKAVSFIESVASYVGTAIRNARIHTDFREAQQKLRLLHKAIEQNPSTVIITDVDGVIQYVNPKTSRHTGYATEELIGHNVNVIQNCTPDTSQAQDLWQTIKSGRSWRGEFCNKKKNGELYWETASISPVKDENGIITNFIKVSEDITHLKAIEAELQEAKKEADRANEAKNRFLTNMSHELRTPLTAVMGFSGLLKHDPNLSESQLDSINIIEHSGEHLLMLVNDLLDISRIEAGNMELFPTEFHLPAFLKDVAETFTLRARNKNLEFQYEAAPDLPARVIGDETKIRQILNNLIGNAIKFTERGVVVLRAYRVDHRLRFQVADTGPGIPREDFARIFVAFQQADLHKGGQEGAGLGLAISKHLAELMGGEIQVESIPKQGTVFSFEVELAEVLPQSGAYQPNQAPIISYKGPRKTVLVVDDSPQIRSLVTKLLSRINFDVEEAENGRQCVDKVATIKPDVILMDLVMPEMDGLEATRAIRNLDLPKQPVILAVTAKTFSEDMRDSLDAGCDDFLPKPIKIDSLLDKMAQHLHLEWDYAK